MDWKGLLIFFFLWAPLKSFSSELQAPEFGLLTVELVEINGKPLRVYSDDGKSFQRDGLLLEGSHLTLMKNIPLSHLVTASSLLDVCIVEEPGPQSKGRVCGKDLTVPADIKKNFDFLIPEKSVSDVDAILLGVYEGKITPDDAKARLSSIHEEKAAEWISLVFPGTHPFRRSLDTAEVRVDYSIWGGLWSKELVLKYDIVATSPQFRPSVPGFSIVKVQPSSMDDYKNFCMKKSDSTYANMRDAWCVSAKRNFETGSRR